MVRPRGTALTLLTLLVLGALAGRAPLHAGDADSDAIRQLQARLDAMEAQNRRMAEALRKRRLFDEEPSGEGLLLIDDNEPFDEEVSVEEDERIRGIVRDYLASQRSPQPAGPSDDDEWYEVGSDTKMSASWKNGLEIESKNHDFRLHVGGRNQFDTGWYSADEGVQQSLPPNARFRDGVDFRRARLRVDGTFYDTMEWAAEFDFVNSAGVPNVISLVAPTDLWWQWNDVPFLQHFRVGNVKDPIGFEHLVSSRFLNFMERSFMQDAFFGGFNNGFMPGAYAFGTLAEERMTYAAGIFNVTTNAFAFNTGSAEYAFTGRLTALPWYVDEGRGLIHVGGSFKQWNNLDDGQARFRTRASVRSSLSANWPIIADTGLINGDDIQQINAELVGVFGPLTIVGEALTSWLQNAELPLGTSRGTLVYRGAYVETLCFLTGEHRAYNRKTGVFDRVVPAENAYLARGEDDRVAYGLGAWELAGRFQLLDLNSNGVNGGILYDTTLGINWYMNPNFKVQANYFYLQREGVTPPGNGAVQGFGIRLAHDF